MKTTCSHRSSALCVSQPELFSKLDNRQVVADFSGGHLSSDGGLLLLRQLDASVGLTRKLSGCFRDRCDPRCRQHSISELLAQRLLALASGYSDLNDHQQTAEKGSRKRGQKRVSPKY